MVKVQTRSTIVEAYEFDPDNLNETIDFYHEEDGKYYSKDACGREAFKGDYLIFWSDGLCQFFRKSQFLEKFVNLDGSNIDAG